MALLNTYHSHNHVDSNPVSSISRSESFSYGYMEHNYMMMEKRQLFLRNYQFCRKRSLTEKIKRSLVRVKRVMWFRLRSARKLRRLVLSRLRFTFYRRRRYIRLMNNHYRNSRNSSCFWLRLVRERPQEKGKNCRRLEALLKDGGGGEPSLTAQIINHVQSLDYQGRVGIGFKKSQSNSQRSKFDRKAKRKLTGES